MQSNAASIVLPPRRLRIHSTQIFVTCVDHGGVVVRLDVKPSYTIEVVIALLHMHGEICWPRMKLWRSQPIANAPAILLECLADDRTLGSYRIPAGQRFYYGRSPSRWIVSSPSRWTVPFAHAF